jgi:hypothetical protein
MTSFTCPRVRVNERDATVLADRAHSKVIVREAGAEDRAQFEPFQMKYGSVASPCPVTKPPAKVPLTSVQTSINVAPVKPMSIPFSFGP